MFAHKRVKRMFRPWYMLIYLRGRTDASVYRPLSKIDGS